jgi:hypothetical protein
MANAAVVADILIKFSAILDMGLNAREIVSQVTRMESEGQTPEQISKFLDQMAEDEINALKARLKTGRGQTGDV